MARCMRRLLKRTLMQDYAVPFDRIWVIPNYVRTDLFSPRLEMRTLFTSWGDWMSTKTHWDCYRLWLG